MPAPWRARGSRPHRQLRGCGGAWLRRSSSQAISQLSFFSACRDYSSPFGLAPRNQSVIARSGATTQSRWTKYTAARDCFAALAMTIPPLQGECRQVDPAPLAVALVAGFGELDALGAFDQRRGKRCVFGDMAQEQFPAGAVAVLERLQFGQFLPLFAEHHLLRLLGAEERPWRRDRGLDEAAMQPSDRRAQGAVDLDLQEVVALHPVRPGRADLRQGAAFQFEDSKGVVLDIDVVGPAS